MGVSSSNGEWMRFQQPHALIFSLHIRTHSRYRFHLVLITTHSLLNNTYTASAAAVPATRWLAAGFQQSHKYSNLSSLLLCTYSFFYVRRVVLVRGCLDRGRCGCRGRHAPEDLVDAAPWVPDILPQISSCDKMILLSLPPWGLPLPLDFTELLQLSYPPEDRDLKYTFTKIKLKKWKWNILHVLLCMKSSFNNKNEKRFKHMFCYFLKKENMFFPTLSSMYVYCFA